MSNLSPWDGVYINIPVLLHVSYIKHPLWRGRGGGGQGVEMGNEWEGYLRYDVEHLSTATSYGVF